MDKKDNKKPSEAEQLKQELAKKDATIADYTDHLKRLQAEFENYCKRVEKERKEAAGFASEKLIVKLLLVIDDFERALKQLTNVPEETRKGIEMIFKNLHKIMDEEKVEPIKAVGEKFDPYKHEVLMQAESDKQDDIVLEELQKGYTMNGKVIRYAKVKISKRKKEEVEKMNNCENCGKPKFDGAGTQLAIHMEKFCTCR